MVDEEVGVEFFDGEFVLLKKKNLNKFLEKAIVEEKKNGYDDDEHIEYLENENHCIKLATSDLKNEDYVCLFCNPMSGWWCPSQESIEEILQIMNETKKIEELRGVLKSNVENTLSAFVEEFKSSQNGSRIITYKELFDYIYDDILKDYEVIDDIEEVIIKKEVKIAISHCDTLNNILENRFDLSLYVIR